MHAFLTSIIVGAWLLVLSSMPLSAQPECTPGDPLTDSQSINVVREWLQMHNQYRCLHNAPPVVWSLRVSDGAAECAKKCEYAHCGTGENIEYGDSSPTQTVAEWYEEAESYAYNNPVYSMDTGHFTQVVWMSTKQIGCSLCANCRVYDAANNRWYSGKAVCQYEPDGNVDTQFAANVSRPMSECQPGVMYYAQGSWRSPATKWAQCWKWSDRLIPDVSIGDPECRVRWQNGNVTAYGSEPPPLYGTWSSIKGVRTIATDIGQYDICWRLLGAHTGPEISPEGPIEACAQGATDRPTLEGLLVDDQPACWGRLPNDHLGIKDKIIWCDVGRFVKILGERSRGE